MDDLQGDPTTDTQTTDAGAQKWQDSLPDELKAHDKLQAFDSVDKLAKAFVDINIPAIPDKPEAYGLDNAEIAARAHALKLTPEQAKAFLEDQNQLAAKQKDAIEAHFKTLQDDYVKTLTESWKVDEAGRKAKVSAIKSKIEGLAGAEMVQAIKDTGAGMNAKFLLGLEKILSVIADDKFIPSQNGKSENTEEERLKKLYPSHFANK